MTGTSIENRVTPYAIRPFPKLPISPLRGRKERPSLEVAARTPKEPSPHSISQLLDKGGEGWSDENISDPEKDMLLAFEEQEKSLPAAEPQLSKPSLSLY
jgi:hypothetical protein